MSAATYIITKPRSPQLNVSISLAPNDLTLSAFDIAKQSCASQPHTPVLPYVRLWLRPDPLFIVSARQAALR
jgi:hypothetical protein